MKNVALVPSVRRSSSNSSVSGVGPSSKVKPQSPFVGHILVSCSRMHWLHVHQQFSAAFSTWTGFKAASQVCPVVSGMEGMILKSISLIHCLAKSLSVLGMTPCSGHVVCRWSIAGAAIATLDEAIAHNIKWKTMLTGAKE